MINFVSIFYIMTITKKYKVIKAYLHLLRMGLPQNEVNEYIANTKP